MEKEIKNINSTRIEVIIILDKESLLSKKQLVLNELCKSASLPGFRPGKVPVKVVETKFDEQITSEINTKVVQDAIKDIENDKTLSVFAIVDVKIDNENEGIKCILTADINPVFELPDYKNFKFPLNKIEIIDTEINEAIDEIRKGRSQYELVERASQKGDFVKVSYIGKLEDGTEIAQAFPHLKMYGNQNGTWEEAGITESYGVKCIIEAILGMAKGDKKTVNTLFDTTLEASELAGKKATYDIEILEVRERKLPELNEEFFKNINVADLESFRNAVKQDITNKKEQENYFKIRESIIKELEKFCTFEAPESAIMQETTSIMRLFIAQQKSRGVKLAEIQKQEQKIIASMREQAINNAKLGFVLDKIASEEKIDIQNEDFEKMLIQDSTTRSIRPEQLIKEIEHDREAIMDMRTRVMRGKTLDLLLKFSTSNSSSCNCKESSCDCQDHSCDCQENKIN